MVLVRFPPEYALDDDPGGWFDTIQQYRGCGRIGAPASGALLDRERGELVLQSDNERAVDCEWADGLGQQRSGHVSRETH
jgi:hypothetical protein